MQLDEESELVLLVASGSPARPRARASCLSRSDLASRMGGVGPCLGPGWAGPKASEEMRGSESLPRPALHRKAGKQEQRLRW